MTYRTMSNPPQEPGTLFECDDCGAIVGNPKRHTLSAHPEQGVPVDGELRSGVADDPRQTSRRF